MRPAVTSTYRFQLHSQFPLPAAQAQLEYVASLGVSHVYCSPILMAVPGSTHGYDVIDHTRINPDIGGRDAFIAFADAAHALGLGVIVDVVPNHMAFPTPASANRPLWQFLEDGPHAPTADWFDVDTSVEDGKIVLPILGQPLADELAAGALTIADDPELGRVLRYDEHVFPLAQAPTSLTPDVAQLQDVLEHQHYRLVHWREVERLNYRRFFDVNELLAICVENPDVFETTHALLLELHESGHIDGFRIDHPDGLADPEGYLEMLTARCAPHTPIWVEKITEPGEELPSSWPCAGTTGYDALAAITGALADDTAAETWRQVYDTALPTPESADPDEATVAAKRYVIGTNLRPEIARLTRLAHRVRPDLTDDALRDAIVEVLVHAPVYRAYVRPGAAEMTSAASDYLDEALTSALESAPGRGADLREELNVIGSLARADVSVASDEFADVEAPVREFCVRFQQTWGPAMAKSVEDTLFYRWSEMLAVNEVGSGIELVDAHGVQRLHDWAQHTATHWPYAMTTLSTHDTKRSEDVRAALLAMSSDPRRWRRTSEAAFALADVMTVDRSMAHLVWQTMAAMGLDVDAERLHDYLAKAMREAKAFTAWIDGDEAYEELVQTYATAILTAEEPERKTGELAADIDARAELAWQLRLHIAELRRHNAEAITLTGHTQKALQLLLPGVADTYQGSEGPTLSLVDPDNRRPVEYDVLREHLSRPGTRGHLVSRLLDADVATAAGPGGSYEPLTTSHDCLIAFVRTSARATPEPAATVVKHALTSGVKRPHRVVFVGVRAAARALADADLPDATVTLPAGRWRHALTDAVVEVGDDPIRLADLGHSAYGPLHVLIQEQG